MEENGTIALYEKDVCRIKDNVKRCAGLKEPSPSKRAGLAQTKTKVRGEGHNKVRGLAQGLCGIPPWPRSLSEPTQSDIQGECSYSNTAKMKLPLKWIPLPNFRAQDQVQASQWPFKGIKWGAFLLTEQPEQWSGLSQPSPSSGNGFPGNGLGEPTQTGGRGLFVSWFAFVCLRGSLSQVREGVMAALSTKKPLTLMPLNGHCNACTWSCGLKFGRGIHLSGNFILTL